jgi:hypothetical protein
VNVGGYDGVDLGDFLVLDMLSDAQPRFIAGPFDYVPAALVNSSSQDGFTVVFDGYCAALLNPNFF